MKDVCGYDPRCFTSASTLSGAIERIKSKVIITLPQSNEMVDLMESLLSGGYSSVHTRVGFESKIFVTPTEDFLIQNGDILKKIEEGGKKRSDERAHGFMEKR